LRNDNRHLSVLPQLNLKTKQNYISTFSPPQPEEKVPFLKNCIFLSERIAGILYQEHTADYLCMYKYQIALSGIMNQDKRIFNRHKRAY
jgi:hypothetical protein